MGRSSRVWLLRALTGYQPEAPEAGRLWIESWHSGIRDPEMRADTLRDYDAWRRVAGAVRRGVEQGGFGPVQPEKVAVLGRIPGYRGAGGSLGTASRSRRINRKRCSARPGSGACGEQARRRQEAPVAPGRGAG